jgi:predicted SAM-dependent methyltransferase
MAEMDQAVGKYFEGPGPYKLEIGAGRNGRRGWLATDLHARDDVGGDPVIALDATKGFPLPSDSFDFIYTEHMIEHISFEHGVHMLGECHRVLKPGGTLRVVTPSIEFLYRVTSSDRTPLEDRYREWSLGVSLPSAPSTTNALFLNNFMRAWGHTFVYDNDTLRLAMQLAGFERVAMCDLNESEHPQLRDLANESRMPDGFLALESMVIEGVKGQTLSHLRGRNLALGKRATQSSVSAWSREDTPEKDASRLVSGTFSGTYNNHTGLDYPAWWRVDLEHPCRISQVRVYNRIDSRHIALRTSQFEIQTSDDDVVWQTVFRNDSNTLMRGSKYPSFVWTPEVTVLARFLRIQLIGEQYLHLEQVEIFGNDEIRPH